MIKNLLATLVLVFALSSCQTIAPTTGIDVDPRDGEITWAPIGKTVEVTEPIVVKSGTVFDGALEDGTLTRYSTDPRALRTGGSSPLFVLEDGAKLSRVAVGSSGGGIHILGNATLEGVHWPDMGGVSVTVKEGTASQVWLKQGKFSGARGAVVQLSDKARAYVHMVDCETTKSGQVIRSGGVTSPDQLLDIQGGSARDVATVVLADHAKAVGTIREGFYLYGESGLFTANNGAKVEASDAKTVEPGPNGPLEKAGSGVVTVASMTGDRLVKLLRLKK